MLSDLPAALTELQDAPTCETLSALLSGNCRAADQTFIKKALSQIAWSSSGKVEPFVRTIKEDPNFDPNIDIDLIAKTAVQDAEYVLQTRHSELLDARAWEQLSVQGKIIRHDSWGDTMKKPGVHLVGAGMGAGKTQNVLIPLAKWFVENNKRMMILVPNVTTAKELAKRIGIPHYVQNGTKWEHKQAMWRGHKQLVACVQSYHIIADADDFERPECLLWDEFSEGLDLVKDDIEKQNQNQHGWKALRAICKDIPHIRWLYALTADVSAGYVVETLQEWATIQRNKMFSYRTTGSQIEGKQFNRYNSKEDLIFNVLQRMEAGETYWIYTDLADKEPQKNGKLKTNFSNFVSSLQRWLPQKKIIAFDALALETTPLGKQCVEMGLAEFAVYARKELGADAIVVSPVGKSQHSVVFEDEDAHLAFDRVAVFGESPHVCSPWGLVQASVRARQTQPIDYFIAEMGKGVRRPVSKTAGRYWVEKHQNESFEARTPAQRLYHNLKIRYSQKRIADQANRNWLFEILVKNRGGDVNYCTAGVMVKDRERFAEILREIHREQKLIETEVFQNEYTRRLELTAKVTEWNAKAQRWSPIYTQEVANKTLEDALSINGDCATRLFMVLCLSEDAREIVDAEVDNLFYVITGMILDEIATLIDDACLQQHRASFADWLLHNDGPLFLNLESKHLDDVDENIRKNFRNIKASIDPSETFGGSVRGIIKMLCNEAGLTFETKKLQKNKSAYRDELYWDLNKRYPGRFPMMKKQNWPDRWERIDRYLREKLNDPTWQPTALEMERLHELPEVVKIEKKQFVSRGVVNAYEYFANQQIVSPVRFKVDDVIGSVTYESLNHSRDSLEVQAKPLENYF